MKKIMKNWIRHPSDLNDPLTGAEITGMTFAGTTLSILQVVISVFITYYYTNVVGISAAVVGTLLLVTRVADGFSDLGMGVIITKTRSKHGQARPWGFRMALPLLAAVILAFYVPQSWNTTARTVYACITYFLMVTVAITPAGLVGSVLGTNMSVNPKSRQKSALITTPLMLVGSVVGNVAVLQITQSMGDSYESWRLVAVVFGVLAFVGQLMQYLLTRERGVSIEPEQKAPKTSIKDSLPALLKNKYFIIMCFVGVMTAIDGAMAGCGIYYLRYVLGRTELMGLMGTLTLAFMLAGVALTPILTKKIPAKRLILVGQIVKIVTFAINLCFPANVPLFFALIALRSLVGAPLMVNSSIYMLNTIEYGEYKTGIRANHLIVSVSSVWSKIGSGIGGALIGWLLAFGRYDGTAAVQSAAAQNMIVNIYFLIPLIAAAGVLVLLSRYDLDKKYAHVMEALKERKETLPVAAD